MSDLLNSASLVMIPSGYKEDVVYSPVPTDGSGDLSFTRASNGTRINSAGLVEVCPWNLLEYSENLNDSSWTKYDISVTANAGVAPNGTTTADKVIPSTSTTNHLLHNTPFYSSLGDYTMSVYIKADGYSKVAIRESWSVGFYASFDLTLGTIIDSSTAQINTITPVGNGWYRLTTSRNFVGDIVLGIIPLQNSYTAGNPLYAYAGDGTSGVLAWGAQINIGSTAKPYFPTTDRLNVPRLTYQNGGGGCPSLLLEKQSTNVSTQSTITSFGSGANDWLNGSNSPASINQTTGIDGTQNGAKYTRTSGAPLSNDFFYKNQVPVTSGTTYTISGYIKLGTASNAVIVTNNTSAWNSVPNGSIVCSTANGFSTTAWKRFELTITGPSTSQINIHYGTHNETGVAAQADGTFFLDGLQVEASSYATSLIPTTSSSATRVADACYKTGISSLIGQTEGTLFFQIERKSGDYAEPMWLSDGSYSNYIYFVVDNTQVRFIGVNSSGGQWNINTTALSQGVHKIAGAYKANDIIFYIDGVQIGTDTNAQIPTCSFLGLGYENTVAYNNGDPYSQVALFKTRLTNAELASLTTI